MQFLSASQRRAPSISVSMNDLSVHTEHVVFHTRYPDFLGFAALTVFASFFFFHFSLIPCSPSLTFHSLTIYPKPSTLVITLRKSQSRHCLMRRWVPVEVFIEMGLYRDWSCLRSPCTKTAFQSLFPLLGDPLSWTQCILFHGGLVILQRCSIIGICQGPQCVFVCV